MPPDLLSFVELVESGRLYESLVEALGRDPADRETRAELKRCLMRDVLARKGNYRNDLTRAFAESFPSVQAFLDDSRRLDRTLTVNTAQQAEATFVLGDVGKILQSRRVPAITIHDTILAPTHHLAAVREAMEEAAWPMTIPLGPVLHGG